MQYENIGNISLNISLILYLIVYIPQIIHNQKITNIEQLSLGMHFLLFVSYYFDLFYGFSSRLPWQYKTVSIVLLLLVTIQHIQLTKFFINKRFLLLAKLGVFFLILNFIGIYCFFVFKQNVLDYNNTLIIGATSRVCGLIYCFPQIIKNKISKSANAINLKFIYLSLTLYSLDTITSFCLNWGYINKLSPPLNIVILLFMLYQAKKYTYKPLPTLYNSQDVSA